MSTEHETLRIVETWLEGGRTRLPRHIIDAVVEQLPATRQRGAAPVTLQVLHRRALAPFALAAAAVVVAVAGIALLRVPALEPTAGSPSAALPTPSLPAVSPTPTQERLTLPGTTASPGGRYGFEGGPGRSYGMHLVVGEGDESRVATALVFRTGEDCLGTREQSRVTVRVAGFDGVSVEPYEPPVQYGALVGAMTRAYRLDVGERTLCAFVTWGVNTTAEERAAALAVVDTIRAEPVSASWIRVSFTLPQGWDVG